MEIHQKRARSILELTLEYARQRDYCGYDKADGMSSRILRTIPVDNKWINIAFQESAKRMPVNIRPLLLVEQRRNSKGVALFACANLAAWELTEDETYRQEARQLLDWIYSNRISGYNGYCVGHQHKLQTLDGTISPDTPDIVSTAYAVRSLLQGRRLDEEYVEIATTAADFVFEDLNYHETASGARINYKPGGSKDSFTLNANALGARLLLDIYCYTNEKQLKKAAQKILNYVVSNQTKSGGWMYRDPPEASHVSMDNYHNGFIIESLLHYQDMTGEDRYKDSIEDALEFYRTALFEPNGAPNWDESSRYPRDTHAAAQGIITFQKAGDEDFASQIFDWTINNLYVGSGRFYYQKERFYTKRFTLMRWCQAWMAYSISRLI